MMIVRSSVKDAARILELQKLAYLSEAAIYNDFTIPPLMQTLHDLSREFATKTVLKAMADEHLIGSVRASQQDGTCCVERLIVHPDFQGRGVGTSLMHKIETCFPNAKRFELFTGHKSDRNIRLYRRLGYEVFKEQRINEALTFTFMEKRR